MIANATGCSSIWVHLHHQPRTALMQTEEARLGVFLFEDNAEYGFGMAVAVRQIREKLAELMTEALDLNMPNEYKEAFKAWLDSKDDADASKSSNRKVTSAS